MWSVVTVGSVINSLSVYFKSFHVFANYGVRSVIEFKKKDSHKQCGEVVVTWHKVIQRPCRNFLVSNSGLV